MRDSKEVVRVRPSRQVCVMGIDGNHDMFKMEQIFPEVFGVVRQLDSFIRVIRLGKGFSKSF